MDFTKFKDITTFVFDVDGVFTNSEIIVMENGDMVRTMNTRDGQAVKYALDSGYKVAIITKGFSEGVRKRFEFLGVHAVYDRLSEKTVAIQDLIKKYSLVSDEILYMGDDIPDLDVFNYVGLTACPADAVPEVMARSMFISSLNGGKGCVREIIEKVMRTQGKWNF